MFSILFVPPNSREIAQMALVRPELEKLGGRIASIALNCRMEELLVAAGFTPKRLSDYGTLNMLSVVDREVPDVIVTNPIGALPLPDAFTMAANYRGIPCLEIFNGVLMDNRVMLRRISSMKPLAISIGRIFRTMTSVSNLRSALCFLATLRATTTTLGFLRTLPYELLRLILPIGRSLKYRQGASLAIPSESSREAMMRLGFPYESLYVTGQPRLDTIFRKERDRGAFLVAMGIPERKHVILLTTQPLLLFWSRKDHETFVSVILRAVSCLPDAELIIKLHPEENLEDYLRIIREAGHADTIICTDTDIYDLIHAASVLLTTHSTTALEAMILDRPVICVDFTGRCPTGFYTDPGAAIPVHSPSELLPALDGALHDEHLRGKLIHTGGRFAREQLHKPDGRTSRRVADVILTLAGQRQASSAGQEHEMMVTSGTGDSRKNGS